MAYKKAHFPKCSTIPFTSKANQQCIDFQKTYYPEQMLIESVDNKWRMVIVQLAWAVVEEQIRFFLDEWKLTYSCKRGAKKDLLISDW